MDRRATAMDRHASTRPGTGMSEVVQPSQPRREIGHRSAFANAPTSLIPTP